MELGLFIRFGGVLPGKEHEAVDFFAETSKIYSERLADGTFTYFEPFLFKTGDFQDHLGFWIIKGPEEKVITWINSHEQRVLRDRAEFIVSHLTVEMLYTGNEVLEEVSILSEIVERTPALVG